MEKFGYFQHMVTLIMMAGLIIKGLLTIGLMIPKV